MAIERGRANARPGVANTPRRPRPSSLYDSYVTYVIQHGPAGEPSEQPAETVAAAARIAIGFVRENRRNVRIVCPDGAVMDFEAFQDAVFQGDLKD